MILLLAERKNMKKDNILQDVVYYIDDTFIGGKMKDFLIKSHRKCSFMPLLTTRKQQKTSHSVSAI